MTHLQESNNGRYITYYNLAPKKIQHLFHPQKPVGGAPMRSISNKDTIAMDPMMAIK